MPELALRRKLWAVDLAALAPLVPQGWAVAEILHFRACDFDAWHRRQPADPLQGHYLLACWKPGSEPRLHDLGPAPAVEPMIFAWRAELEAGRMPPDACGLKPLLADRIAAGLGGAKGLVLCGDGEFMHVPLDLLPFDGSTLFDKLEIRQYLTARDLLRRGRPTPHPAPALAAGGGQDGGWLSKLWAVLGSPAEADEVAAIARGSAAATPKAFMEGLGPFGPSVLHLGGACGFRYVEPRPGPWENPMKQAWVSTPVGLMQALAVTGLDLSATGCVVLPGMQTPAKQPGAWPRLGGLLAAFAVAGAANIVHSFWPSPARRAVVRNLHKAMKAGHSPPEALRLARLAARAKNPSPAAWAGWACLGEMA